MVHEHERRAAPRGDAADRGIAQEPADVVDDRRTAIDRRLRHLRLVCVDGDRHADPAMSASRTGTRREFFVGRQRSAPGRRRFAADVENVGPFLDHPQRRIGRPRGIEPDPSVGKGVRRHVDDGHYSCRRAPSSKPPAIGQRQIVAFHHALSVE